MIGYIYYIINKETGKRYVGQTINIKSRKEKHYTALRNNYHHSHKLQRAFNKYGEEKFDFIYEEYQIDSQRELFCREIDMINYYNSYYDGYNETLGGEGHNTKFDLHTSTLIYQIGLRYDGVKHKLGKYFNCDRTTITKIFNSESLEDEAYDDNELNELIQKIDLKEDNLRGRYKDNYSRKLTTEQVLEILSIMKLKGFSQASCAKAYGVNKDIISGIVRNKTYVEDYQLFNSLDLDSIVKIMSESPYLEEIEKFHYEGKRAPVKNPLTQEQVNFILDNENKMTKSSIARELNISIDRVSSVCNRKSYQDYIHIYEKKHNIH